MDPLGPIDTTKRARDGGGRPLTVTRLAASDGLAAVSEPLAHEQTELARPVAVLAHSAVGHGGNLRYDVQLLGNGKGAELPGPGFALEQAATAWSVRAGTMPSTRTCS